MKTAQTMMTRSRAADLGIDVPPMRALSVSRDDLKVKPSDRCAVDPPAKTLWLPVTAIPMFLRLMLKSLDPANTRWSHQAS